MTYVLDPVAPWRLDGILLDDGAGNPLRLNPLTIAEETPYSTSWTLANTKRVVYKSGTANGMHGPSGSARRAWTVDISNVNPVLRKIIERKVRRPITHQLACKIMESVSFTGGPNPTEPLGMTEAYLDRYLLSAGYTATAGLGANAPWTEPTLFEVWNESTGAQYTNRWYRSVEVVNNAALLAGDTIYIRGYDLDGALLYSNDLVAGVDWVIGADEDATAVNIAAAMAGLGYLTAGALAHAARFWKADDDLIVLNVTTSVVPATMEVHPNATEVQVDIVYSPWRFRNLKFGAAPGSEAGIITVVGHYIYRVAAKLLQTSLAGHYAPDNVAVGILIEDLGVAGVDPLGAP